MMLAMLHEFLNAVELECFVHIVAKHALFLRLSAVIYRNLKLLYNAKSEQKKSDYLLQRITLSMFSYVDSGYNVNNSYLAGNR